MDFETALTYTFNRYALAEAGAMHYSSITL